jgi:D-xylose transport system permease protein
MQALARNIHQIFSRYKILALLLSILIIWTFFGYFSQDGFGNDKSVYFHPSLWPEFAPWDGTFLSARNFSNLLRQMSVTGMLAAGMVFVIIAGEIDLSVGSLLGLLGGMSAVLDVSFHLPLALNFTIVLGLGLVLGMFNGYWVAYLRVPSFIVGLAGMLIFRGILLGVTGGMTISIESPTFIDFGEAYLPKTAGYVLAVVLFVVLAVLSLRGRANRKRYQLAVPQMWQDVTKLVVMAAVIAGFVGALNAYQGIPLPVLLMLVILGVFTFIARNTVFGRRIYAVGSNLEATRLSGVNTKLIKLALFGLMGLMCAMAGLTNTARQATGSPSAGNMGELDAIASCFIGGTSMRGGAGTVLGAVIGALIMASLDNGMSMLSVESYWQMIVKGSILLLAVWIDVMSGSSER